MKKFLLFAIFCFSLSASSFAQITVTRADMPAVGDTIRVSSAMFTMMDPSLTGENYQWNFSDLNAMSQRVVSYISPTSTPFFYQIVFNPATANLATPIDQLDFLTQMQMTNAYEFYKASETNYVRPGYAVTITGIPVPMKFDQPELLYSFPLSYSSPKDSSISNYSITFPGLGHFSIERSRVNEVDGWGEITTPLGTFDVLRIKSTIHESDSLYVDSLQMGTPIIRDVVEYQWIANNMGIPVLTISIEQGMQTITYPDKIENLINMVVDLGPDRDICEGEEIELSPVVTGGIPPYSYTWSNGDTSPSITVSPADTTTYIVGVLDSEMNFMMDEITINVLPFPQFELGADTTICAQHQLTFTAPAAYDNIKWYINGALVSQAASLTVDSTGTGLGTIVIRVEYAQGECASWDEINVAFQLCSGLNKIATETARLYPNPVGDLLGITLDWPEGELQLTIHSMDGRLVFAGSTQLKNKMSSLDINNLMAGNYFILIRQHNRMASARFIKE
ncbi:MAG: T9SS type A sorting domain-containing protein [Lentimicrobiaceae bacterium]|nr:T9SS type A sorting domain-containing protein [Lentimicrobiaceae bacterium]